MKTEKRAFERAFYDAIAAERSENEARDAIESYFRQLSNHDYQQMLKSGTRGGEQMARAYFKQFPLEVD